MVMIAWLLGIVLLLGRLASAHRRFRACLEHVIPLDELSLAINMRELCRSAGVSQAIRIVESDGIAAPAVWGIARPTIILPRGIAASLTNEQLRWVLLHELAHVRRHDLVIVTLQRFAAILHFFNPVIWIANRIIDQLREYACDDLAVSLSHSSAVESGEAFMRDLAACRSEPPRSGRSPWRLRAGFARVLSPPRSQAAGYRPADPHRAGPTVGLGLDSPRVVSVPHLRAANEVPPADPRAPTKEFELRVVGPDGQPIPKALVELRTSPAPTAEQFRRGTFVRRGSYEAFAEADAEGRLVVELPPAPKWFDVSITIPGYGPYWAGWTSETHAQPIPPRLTAELEAAWSVGGIIVDGAGKPVEGVKVRPQYRNTRNPPETFDS